MLQKIAKKKLKAILQKNENFGIIWQKQFEIFGIIWQKQFEIFGILRSIKVEIFGKACFNVIKIGGLKWLKEFLNVRYTKKC